MKQPLCWLVTSFLFVLIFILFFNLFILLKDNCFTYYILKYS